MHLEREWRKLNQCLSLSPIIMQQSHGMYELDTSQAKGERAQESQIVKDNGHTAHGMLNLPLEENDKLEERGRVRETTKSTHGRGDTICSP